MKPIQLTMCAFGPYKQQEVIDFTKLHEHRLFVISGATGAGKTTIFDGICFALYGLGSGQDRKDTKMLRSDFAEDTVHTSVELIFEIHGRTYRVLRQLPHVKEGRKSATGEKYEFFELLSNGEEVPVVERQRVTDINQKLEEIIGLSYDQFSQIVMLPQGEFRKLLTSQSDNKEEILRKIFKTNRYGEMTLKLEEKKRQAEQKLNEARLLKNSYIGQIMGALPPREDSNLFEVLNQNSNVYQIQHALDEEIHYYQQKINEDQKKYDSAVEKHREKYELFVANQALNERIEAYEKKVVKLREIEQQKPYFEQIRMEYEAAIRASRIDPLNAHCQSLHEEKQQQQQKFIQVTDQLEKAKKNFHNAQSSFQTEFEKQKERDEALKKVMELQKLIPLYEQIEKQTQVVNTLTTEVKKIFAILNDSEKKLADKKELITKLQVDIEQLEIKTEKLNNALEQQNYLREVVHTFTQYYKLKQKVTELEKQYNTTNNDYEVLKKAYVIEERKWLNNQAAILATHLVPGTPCPVCGSTEHQISQREMNELVDEETLNRMKEKLGTAEKKKYSVEANLNTLANQVVACEKELQRLDASIDQQEVFLTKFNEINIFVQQLQEDKEQLAKQKRQLKQLQEDANQSEQIRRQNEELYQQKNNQLLQQATILDQQRQSIPKNLQHFNQLQKALYEAEEKRNTLQTAWEKIQKEYQDSQTQVATSEEALKYTSQLVKKIEEKLESAKQEFKTAMLEASFENYKQFELAKRSEKEQHQLQQQYVQFTNELHSLTTQVHEEQKQLQGKEKVDLTLAEQQLVELKEAYEKAFQTLSASRDCERNCIDFSEKLDRVADEIYQLEEVSNQIVDLYNLLRGQNSKKISFERYVQMGYLEQITEAANIRLKSLSNGQYYLQCSDRQESHGRQSGLSLDVLDMYTGQSRDVKSLSGGEKFNASLSLALGMADVIQSYQGNVEIDTMFIDEGFGSLDEESLIKAIDTLIDIQKSGRMIGVISHVAELKAAMPAILNVEKLKEGYSHTTITVK